MYSDLSLEHRCNHGDSTFTGDSEHQMTKENHCVIQSPALIAAFGAGQFVRPEGLIARYPNPMCLAENHDSFAGLIETRSVRL